MSGIFGIRGGSRIAANPVRDAAGSPTTQNGRQP